LCSDNFHDLDELLRQLDRPINPHILSTGFPPCHFDHGKHDPCDVCDAEVDREGHFNQEYQLVEGEDEAEMEDIPSETRGDTASEGDGFEGDIATEEDEENEINEDDAIVKVAGTSEGYPEEEHEL
jgi:hypothetical protein